MWKAQAYHQCYSHRLGGTTVGLIVMSALALVEDLLSCALVFIGLSTAGETVGCIGKCLLDLVLSGLGGIRSKLLLGLCETY